MFAGLQSRKKFGPFQNLQIHIPLIPLFWLFTFFAREVYFESKILWYYLIHNNIADGTKKAQNWWHWILPCNIFKINTAPNSNTKNEGSSSSSIKFHLSLHGTFKLLNSVSSIQEIELCKIKKLTICSIGFLEFIFLKLSNMFDNFKKLYSRKHTL